MRPHRPTILVSMVAVVVASLFAAGCGGGGSSGVAGVAVSSTMAPRTTQGGPGTGGSAGGGSPAASRGGNHTVMNVGDAAQGAKFAACIRAHGVQSFPDPDAQGLIQFGAGIDPRSPSFRSAFGACRKLLPTGFGRAPTAAQLAQVQQRLLAFSTCMRAHAIADFPDPSGGGLPRIQPHGDLDPNSPQFRAAYTACRGHLPSGLPDKALGGLAPPA